MSLIRTTHELALLLGLALGAAQAWGNNVQVTGTPVLTGNTGTTVQVQFSLSWENSWRTSSAPANWDAAWVFVKYRDAAGIWRHANLNGTGHVAPGSRPSSWNYQHDRQFP